MKAAVKAAEEKGGRGRPGGSEAAAPRRRAHYTIAFAAFVAIYFLHVPFPLMVLAAAGVGLVGARFRPGAFAAAPGTKEADARTEGKVDESDVLPLVIEEHAPPPSSPA